MRIEGYDEFVDLLRQSNPKKGELLYAARRSEKDGNLFLITSAALEIPEETNEIKADTYDFAFGFNSWFDDDEKLDRSHGLLTLLKEKKGLPVDSLEMANRRKLRNVQKIKEFKEKKEKKKNK